VIGPGSFRKDQAVLLSAALVSAISLSVLALAVWRALVIEPLPIVSPARPLQEPKAIQHREAPAGEILVSAVLNDPFRPDRQAPSERFLLPENRPALNAADSSPRGMTGGLILLGTVVRPEGGAAMVEGGTESRVIRVGETFHGLKLRKVERGRAVFTTPDGSSEILEIGAQES
jgi:hypothetical protein